MNKGDNQPIIRKEVTILDDKKFDSLSSSKIFRFVTEIAMAKTLLQCDLIDKYEYQKIVKKIEDKYKMTVAILCSNNSVHIIK